jgi:Cu-Zn family superoxide dismutase
MIRAVLFSSVLLSSTTLANMMPPPPPPVTVEMHAITAAGAGAAIGTITIRQTGVGLMLSPNFRGLPPGERGFHVHETGQCGPALKDGAMVAGLAAGPHYDPDGHGLHAGPRGAGHRGDLEVLTVAADGTATQAVVAPRLTLKDLAGRSLMIHAGGDNYSDTPAPLGGGGARIACGVVPIQWDGYEPPASAPDPMKPVLP